MCRGTRQVGRAFSSGDLHFFCIPCRNKRDGKDNMQDLNRGKRLQNRIRVVAFAVVDVVVVIIIIVVIVFILKIKLVVQTFKRAMAISLWVHLRRQQRNENEAGVAVPERRVGVVGRRPPSGGVIGGWGPRSKMGGFQLQADCWLAAQGSKRGWELRAGGPMQDRKPGIKCAVTRWNPGSQVPLEIEHYDPREDLWES